MNKRAEDAMHEIDLRLQTYKRTGEIKKASRPIYRAKRLEDCYGRCSQWKKKAYNEIIDFLFYDIGSEFVTSWGITSYNTCFFYMAAVVELENKYVIYFKASGWRAYLLEE